MLLIGAAEKSVSGGSELWGRYEQSDSKARFPLNLYHNLMETRYAYKYTMEHTLPT